MENIYLSLQADAVLELLNEINGLLAPDIPPEVRQLALNLLERPSEIVSFDLDRLPAGGTGECRIRLKPGDGLLNLLLTLRAWDRQLNVAV